MPRPANDGCKVFPHCLTCPLPVCVEDDLDYRNHLVRQSMKRGTPWTAIAATFQLTPQDVRAILADITKEQEAHDAAGERTHVYPLRR